MDSVIPKSLQSAIDSLAQLPGVGPRTAERYAYFLLKADKSKSQAVVEALKNLHENIKYCPKTFALIEANQELSPLYRWSGFANRQHQSGATAHCRAHKKN
jgi:recombination protein RecR